MFDFKVYEFLMADGGGTTNHIRVMARSDANAWIQAVEVGMRCGPYGMVRLQLTNKAQVGPEIARLLDGLELR